MVPGCRVSAVATRFALAALLAALASCSSSALGPEGGAGNGGSAGSGAGSTGSAGAGGAGSAGAGSGGAGSAGAGSGGAGGAGSAGSGGAGSGGAGRHCGSTFLRANVVVHLPNGDLSCSTAPLAFATSTTAWVGRVTSSDTTSIIVEGCAPNAPASDGGAPDGGPADAGVADAGVPEAGCTPATVRIEAHALGLDLTRFPTGWVRVKASVSRFYACQQSLELTTADPGDGSPPQGPPGKLILAVVDGNGVSFDDSPYKVAHVPLGCAPARACNGNATGADVYALEFSEAGGAGAPLRLYMDETATWSMGGTAFAVHNLRSFQSEACDDYWNWAYTIYADPK